MSQKIENQLNLALDITEEERQKSESLDIGYDLEEKEWDKYAHIKIKKQKS